MLQRIFRSILTFLRRVWGDQPVGWATLLPGLLLTAVLLALPTGYEGAVIYQGTEKVRATVLATNEDTVISTGLIQTGEQVCTLRIEEGLFKGREVQGDNLLSGSLSQDKIFAPGDSAFVVVSYQGGHRHLGDDDRPLPHHLGMGAGPLLCAAAHPVCRPRRRAGTALLRDHGAGHLEGDDPHLPEGRQPAVDGAFCWWRC